jgi:hypothetical protein
METLFEKAVIRIGIDTIRIKLDNISIIPFDPMNQLINDLEQSFDEDEIDLFPKDGIHYVKDIDSNCSLAKIYKTGNYSCMVEIFGMCQTITEFKLTDYHRIILSVIGNLKNTLNTLEKMDVSLDFFYPHDRSFAFDNSKRADFVDILNYQRKFHFVHLTNISMHTIRVPNSEKKIINSVLKNYKYIKSQEDKKHGDCYYRWVKQEAPFLNWINYSRCEKGESSHFEIKINDRKTLYKIIDLFDGCEKYSSDYDPEEDIFVRRGKKKVSIIKYNKSKRDEDKHGCVQDVYNGIIKDISDTDDEYDDLMDCFRHTRVEFRFYQPAVSTRQDPLDLNSESSYDKLLCYIKKEIEKMTIFILKPDISTDDYLDLYKKRLKKVSVTKPLTPDDYGRILEVTGDEWNDFENKVNFLKSQFIK